MVYWLVVRLLCGLLRVLHEFQLEKNLQVLIYDIDKKIKIQAILIKLGLSMY